MGIDFGRAYRYKVVKKNSLYKPVFTSKKNAELYSKGGLFGKVVKLSEKERNFWAKRRKKQIKTRRLYYRKKSYHMKLW